MENSTRIRRILKEIQGNPDFIYAELKIEGLSDMMEDVQVFYPRNENDIQEQEQLKTNIEQFQIAIQKYSSKIDSILESENYEFTRSELEELKNTFNTLTVMDKQLNDKYYCLIDKYE